MNTDNKINTVGVIGLGNMGMPICTNLVKAGFTVIGCARTTAKLGRLKENGGIPAGSIAELGQKCKYIITTLPTEDALASAVTVLQDVCAPGTIVIETSTTSLNFKTQCRDALAEKEIIMLDAPLSGTGAQAVNRDVVVYASGDHDVIETCRPIFDGFARLTYDLGEFGKGTSMKFIANQMVAIHNQSAAEAILFGVRCGLDPQQVVDVISSGAGGSKMLQVRGPMMAKKTFSPATMSNRVFQKDLKLISDALRESGTPSPLFMTTIPYYTAATAGGHAEDDTASIYDVLEKMCKSEEN